MECGYQSVIPEQTPEYNPVCQSQSCAGDNLTDTFSEASLFSFSRAVRGIRMLESKRQQQVD